MAQRKQLVSFGTQIGLVVAANICILILGLVQLPILTAALGVTLYGIWSVINVTISLVVPFALLGFGMSIVRFLAAERDITKVRDDLFSAYTLVSVTGAVFSLLMLFLSDFLAESIFREAGAATYIRLAAILVLLNALRALALAFFRMRQQMGRYAVLDMLYHAVQVSLVLVAVVLGYRLSGVIVAFILNAAAFNVAMLVMIIRQVGFRRPGLSNLGPYLRWGLPLTPNIALLWVVHTSDRYMVSYFLGVASAGVYSAAYAIGNYASFALMPVATVLYPRISESYDEGDLGETKSYLRYAIKYLMLVAVPSAFGLSVLARPLLQILTTAEFTVGSIVVPWVAFGAVLFCFRQICLYIIHLVGKTHVTVPLLSVGAVLNIALNLLLIPRIGILGAAVATLVAYGVLGILTLAVTRRYLKFDLNLPFIGRSVASAAVMALCIWLIGPQSIVSVLLSIVLGAVIYFAVLVGLRGLSKSELAFFAGFVRDNLRKIGLFRR